MPVFKKKDHIDVKIHVPALGNEARTLAHVYLVPISYDKLADSGDAYLIDLQIGIPNIAFIWAKARVSRSANIKELDVPLGVVFDGRMQAAAMEAIQLRLDEETIVRD